MKKYVQADIDMTYFGVGGNYQDWDEDLTLEDLAPLTKEEKQVIDYNDYVYIQYLIAIDCVDSFLKDCKKYEKELDNWMLQNGLPDDIMVQDEDFGEEMQQYAKKGYITVPQEYIDNIKKSLQNALDWVEHFEDKLDQ